MKKVLLFSVITAILVLSFTGKHSQSEKSTNKFKISVLVNCKDEITKNSIQSFINRELRSLQDVIVITDPIKQNPTHALSLIAIEREYQTGGKTGEMAIAAVYIEKIYPYALLAPHVSKEKLTELLLDVNVFPDLVYSNYINCLLQTIKTSNLSDACKTIVANFDTVVLEEARKKK